MTRGLFRVLFLLAASSLLAQAGVAADLLVISSMPMAPGLTELAETFKRETGQEVRVQGMGTADITRILTEGQPFDVLVATSALVDQALQAKRAASDTRTSTGRVGIAVVVRNGAPAPQIATPENLRQAALAADALVFNTAGSGQAVQRMFDAMGILAQIQPRVTRPTNAAETMDRILQGKGAELGFGLLSEIKPYEMKGIRVVGPLPDALQSYINYEGIASDSSSLSNTARTFLRYIGTPAARQVFARTGVD